MKEKAKGPEFTEGRNSLRSRKIVSNSKMYYLYILRTKNNSLYVGVTGNVEARIIRHVIGGGAEFTRRNGVKELVYTESYDTLIQARSREKQIKGWTRLKKENLIKYGLPYSRDSYL